MQHFLNQTSDDLSTEEAIDGAVTVYIRGPFAGATLDLHTRSPDGEYRVSKKFCRETEFTLYINGFARFALYGTTDNTDVSVHTEAIS